MATKAKAKPVAKKAPAKKAAPKAKKPAATKTAAAVELMEVGTFGKFTGYRSEVDDDENVFNPDELVYIIAVDEDDSGVLYSAITASDVELYEAEGADAVNGGQIAPSEVKALTGGALDKAREQFMPIRMIGKLAEMMEENDNEIEVAVELNQSIQESYFYLGGALARVLQRQSHLVENGGDYEGDEAFNDFCQAEFGFKASKGRNLARIYQTFSSLPDFDPASLAGIGWSIAAKIEKYVTADNVTEVIEAASEPEVTQRTVDSIMKEKFVAADGKSASGKAVSRGPDKLVTKSMTFSLTEDSAESVEIALNACMKQHGLPTMEQALERIVVEWANEHVQAASTQKRIQGKANKAAKAREAAEAAKATKAAPKTATKAAAKPKKASPRRKAA